MHEKQRVDRAMPARIAIPLPELAPLRGRDVLWALRAGTYDFVKAPEYGLMVAGAAVGLGLFLRFAGGGHYGIALCVASLLVPLIAPIFLSGFYEISTRRAAGQHFHVVDIWQFVASQRRGQSVWVGIVLTALMGLWALVALVLWQLTGTWGTAVALQALLAVPICVTVYGIAAISLPMLHNCRLDALTAMLHSHAMVRDNRFVMLLWALLAGGLIWGAVSTWFIGLIVVLPILGHAQWHLYRRAVL